MAKASKKKISVKERVRKHIQDKNDVITDEDIKNIDINEAPDEKPLDIPGNAERPKDEDKDAKQITPWDVIKE